MQFSFHTIDLPDYTAKCVEFARQPPGFFRWKRVRIGIITDYPASCRYPLINIASSVYQGSICFFRFAIAWDGFRTPSCFLWLCDRWVERLSTRA